MDNKYQKSNFLWEFCLDTLNQNWFWGYNDHNWLYKDNQTCKLMVKIKFDPPHHAPSWFECNPNTLNQTKLFSMVSTSTLMYIYFITHIFIQDYSKVLSTYCYKEEPIFFFYQGC